MTIVHSLELSLKVSALWKTDDQMTHSPGLWGQSVLKYVAAPPARSVSPTAPAASPSPPCHQGLFFQPRPSNPLSQELKQLGHRALSWCLSSAWVEKLYSWGWVPLCFWKHGKLASEWIWAKALSPMGLERDTSFSPSHSFWFFWGFILLPSLGPWKYLPVFFQKSLLFLIKLIWVVAVPWNSYFLFKVRVFNT